MKPSHRLFVSLGVVVLLVGGLCVYRSQLPATGGQKSGGNPVLRLGEVDEIHRAETLEQHRQLTMWRTREQQRIVGELLARRCTLLQAAAQFRGLYRGDPVLAQVLRTAYPEGSDDERVCRWVLTYTRPDTEDRPDGAEIMARLEAEFQEHLERGTLHLMEPGQRAVAVGERHRD
jgi:hypothetical protein